MYILVTVSGMFFSGFSIEHGFPIWCAHPAQAEAVNARQAAKIVQSLKAAGYEMRRQSLTRRT